MDAKNKKINTENSLEEKVLVYAKGKDIFVLDDNKEYLVKSRVYGDTKWLGEYYEGVSSLVSVNDKLYDIVDVYNGIYDMYESNNIIEEQYQILFETFDDVQVNLKDFNNEPICFFESLGITKIPDDCYHSRKYFVDAKILEE